MKIIIATIKSWNLKNANKFKDSNKEFNVSIVSDSKLFTYKYISEINPDYIFFPHWSWTITENIYKDFKCVVFHMGDLPYGRGGSPLQNHIVNGIENTKISAIAVDGGIDTGDIYLKRDLNLNGGAEEIYIRASDIIFNDMIPYILQNNITPTKQIGKGTFFKRRSLEQSEINPNSTLKEIFDLIRMLDAEGYLNAYIKFGNYKLSFSRPKLLYDKIHADVEISLEN